MMPLLSAKNVGYRAWGRRILAHCDLALYANEVAALVGSNGAGKTTLMSLLAGLKSAQVGTIDYHFERKSQWLGFLPDKAPLYPSMRVGEFLRYCAQVRGVREVSQAVDFVVARCQLQAVLGLRCQALSHGYRQRVGLAQAWIHAPQILLLDEPTNGLDDGQKQALRPLLAEMAHSASVLMISHDYEEIIATANRVYVMQDGRCEELLLPPREGLWWLSFKEVPTSFVLEKVIDEGRFIAVSAQHYSLARLYEILANRGEEVLVGGRYPVAALQERIANVG